MMCDSVMDKMHKNHRVEADVKSKQSATKRDVDTQ